ncbi:MAG: GNAT family N-acetyltransferase [Caldilineaceae bacterium]
MNDAQSLEFTPPFEYRRDDYLISSDRSLLHFDVIHAYLERSYWSPGITRALVEKAARHSLCFGAYQLADGENSPIQMQLQVGYARVITDFATFAYLADVFILPTHRQQGLGVWLIDCIVNCPAIDGIRSFLLATRNAHDLYRKFGFEIPTDPRRLMIKRYEMAWYNPAMVEETNARSR